MTRAEWVAETARQLAVAYLRGSGREPDDWRGRVAVSMASVMADRLEALTDGAPWTPRDASPLLIPEPPPASPVADPLNLPRLDEDLPF